MGSHAGGASTAPSAMLAAAMPGGEAVAARPVAQLNYGEKVSAAKQMVGHDSERVAEIVKGWVKADG